MLDAEFLAGPGQQIDRHQIHEIHEPDQHENRDGQRRDQFALAVIGLFDGAIDELDQHFERAPAVCPERRWWRGARPDEEHQDEQQASKPR